MEWDNFLFHYERTDFFLFKLLPVLVDNKASRLNVNVIAHKTIDTLIADMVKTLYMDEQTARDTVADLIRNNGKLSVVV